MLAKQKIMTIKWLEIWEENKNKNWTVSQNEIKIENIAYIDADNRNIFSIFFITQIIHSTCGWNITIPLIFLLTHLFSIKFLYYFIYFPPF